METTKKSDRKPVIRKSKIIYRLTIEDIQTVANEELERDLTAEEIEKIIDPIAERIRWHDAISDSISSFIE